jgi:dinuclear metal center YbgI/SA1388 family protein
MVNAIEVIHFINDYLAIDVFDDYCPNGLQVQGRNRVNHIVTGVTASQALLDKAVVNKADLIVVHHGYFWKNEDPIIVGPMRQRLQTLLKHDINLLAYHLPLDVHSVIGNNHLLGDLLGIVNVHRYPVSGVPDLLSVGEFESAISATDLANLIESKLSRKPLHIQSGAGPIKKIAWCTGAAQDMLTAAADYDVDAFITGEVSERTVHMARELGVDFYAAGHHATERFGVQALADLLPTQFDVTCEFIDIDNPV